MSLVNLMKKKNMWCPLWWLSALQVVNSSRVYAVYAYRVPFVAPPHASSIVALTIKTWGNIHNHQSYLNPKRVKQTKTISLHSSSQRNPSDFTWLRFSLSLSHKLKMTSNQIFEFESCLECGPNY